MKKLRLTDTNEHEYYVNADDFRRCDNIIFLYTKDKLTTMINFNNILMIEELETDEEIL